MEEDARKRYERLENNLRYCRAYIAIDKKYIEEATRSIKESKKTMARIKKTMLELKPLLKKEKQHETK
jgi:hypothetical protein